MVDTPDRLRGGLCVDIGPQMFFSLDKQDEQAAKKVCAECPVREECLMKALNQHEEHGVWGGLTEKERRALKRRMRRMRAQGRQATG